MRQQDEGSPNGSGTASFYVRNTLDGMSTPTAADPADVAWDLEPLVDGDGAEGVDHLLDEAGRRAAAVAEAHGGRVAELDGPGLAAASSRNWQSSRRTQARKTRVAISTGTLRPVT